jgi:tetratricopeptide (TPR) repeat protein
MKLASLLAGLASASILITPLAATALPAPPSGKAEAPDEGRDHFNRGVALFHEGDYRAALVEFRRAYEISHKYRVLYNIGQAEFEVQNYAGARSSFQKYLLDGGAEIEAGRRAEVEADIKKLSGRVARIEIKTNAAGADILLDDSVIGQAPLKEPLQVSAGRRKITVQQGALPPVTRFVELAGGDDSSVTINLAAAEPPPRVVTAPASPAPTPVAPPAPSRTALWISLAGTGALATGAVVTGILALGAHSDAEKTLGTLGVTAADVEAAHSKAATLGLVTDVLGGAAIVMGGVSIVLAATSGKSRVDEAKPRATLLLSPRGALLTGRF